MASGFIHLHVHANWRRANALLQETRGMLRRAAKNDRPAIVDRQTRRVTECVRVVPRG